MFAKLSSGLAKWLSRPPPAYSLAGATATRESKGRNVASIRERIRSRNRDALEIANYIIVKAVQDDDPKTPLEIMKLMYFSHAWMLAIFGRPLFRHQFQVWTYGPVIPHVYYAMRRYEDQPVTAPVGKNPKSAILDKEEHAVLDRVIDIYGKHDAWRLSSLSHVPEGPWARARVRKGLNSPISNSDIQRYYRQRRKSNLDRLEAKAK